MELSPILVPDLVNSLCLMEPRVRKNYLFSKKIQRGHLCFLNYFSKRSLGVTGSRFSPRHGQWFMSNGITYIDLISINSTCYQSLIKDLMQIRGISALVMKNLLASGKESQTLRGVPAEVESHLACSPAAIQGHLKLGSSNDPSLPQEASLRGFPAQGEITAIQQCCLAGRAERRLT